MDTQNEQNGSRRKPFRPDRYEDFFDPSHAALDIAADLTGSQTLLSRHIWRKRLDAIGEEAFREVLFLFWSDLRAGESVRSRERALTARLNRAIVGLAMDQGRAGQ